MTVPLSEREKRILDEIEKNLYQEDPQFARDVKPERPRSADRRRMQVGILLFLVGFATLIGFFATGNVVVGVLAFGAMVGGIVVIAGSIKGSATANGARGPALGERISQNVRAWEERFRQRYRRR